MLFQQITAFADCQ